MSNAKVAISIVTYNSKHIFDVLNNLKTEFGVDQNYRFVIFDNNSNEDYKQQLREYMDFAEITFFMKITALVLATITTYYRQMKSTFWSLIQILS